MKLVPVVLAVALALVAPAVAWPLAVVGVLVIVLAHVEGSEVTHLVFLVQAAVFLALGAGAAALAWRAAAPWPIVAFVAPTVVHHLRASFKAWRARAAAEEPLRRLATPALVLEAALREHSVAVVADHVLDRPDGREALRQAARGSEEERRGAIEVAVFVRERDPALAHELAGVVLEGASGKLLERALVAIWEGAEPALVERLREVQGDARALALEVRARSGDERALDEWLADATLDARTTGSGIALGLGTAASVREKLVARRAAHPEGTPPRARLEVLIEQLEIYG